MFWLETEIKAGSERQRHGSAAVCVKAMKAFTFHGQSQRKWSHFFFMFARENREQCLPVVNDTVYRHDFKRLHIKIQLMISSFFWGNVLVNGAGIVFIFLFLNASFPLFSSSKSLLCDLWSGWGSSPRWAECWEVLVMESWWSHGNQAARVASAAVTDMKTWTHQSKTPALFSVSLN